MAWVKIETVTKEYLLEQLENKNCVWARDDYLSMRGMAYHSDRELYDVLEHTANLKEELRAEGHVFTDYMEEM